MRLPTNDPDERAIYIQMPNNRKIVELYEQLTETELFDGSSPESSLIEAEFSAWASSQLDKYSFKVFQEEVNSRLKELESKEIDLPFSKNEIKALQVLAGAALSNSQPQISEPQPEVKTEPTIKRVRRRNKKEEEILKNPEDDEWMDSPYPMKDPQTGQQMIDKDGKPLFLRVKKNAPKQVVPPGYKPPPPQSVANNLAMQEEAILTAKTKGFQLPGSNLTLADLIKHSAK